MKTLLLEAGPCTNTGLSTQSIPLLASRIHHSNVDWNYEMEPQSVGGSVFPEGRVPIPRAKVLGGCAEINFMLHVRGTAGDYDGWAEEVSDSSWNSTFMSKMEDKYESFVEPLLPERPHPYIGTFLSAANRTEYGVQQDYNERSQVRSGAFVYRHASKNGVRQSSARQMLLPQMKTSTNLHVLTNAHVQKLNFEGKKVTSVRVSHGDEVFDIKARHEVILSAGSYASPQLLQLSGVGPKDHLEEHNVDLVQDLPGVGEHLQDHYQTYLKVRVGSGKSYYPTSISALHLPRGLFEWLISGTGIFETSGVGTSSLIATTSIPLNKNTHTNRIRVLWCFGEEV